MDGAIPQAECDARQCDLCRRPLDGTGGARAAHVECSAGFYVPSPYFSTSQSSAWAHTECSVEFHNRMNEKCCIYCGTDAPGSTRCTDCEGLDSPPFLGYPGAS